MNEPDPALRDSVPPLNRHMGDRFRLIFEASPTALVLVDHLGRIMMANTSAAELLGYAVDALSGEPVERLVAEEMRTGLTQSLANFLARPERRAVAVKPELRALRRDGAEVMVRMSLSPVASREGMCVLASLVDMSDHVRAQEQMHHRRYLEGIVASLLESLVVLDPGLKVVSASKSFYRAFGLVPADTEGRNFFELDGGRWDVPELRTRLGDILPKNQPLDQFEVLRDAGGPGRRMFLLNAHRIDREACKTDLIVLAIEDITKRKQVEEALLHQRELLHVLLDNFPASIYYKDIESRFTEVSRFKAHRHGKEPAELTGKTDFDVFPEARARKSFEDEQRIIRTGEAMINMEEKESWSDRPDTWTLTSKMPLKDHAGRIIGTFGISHDITERKRAEEEIRQRKTSLERANAELARSNAELAQFAYVASHDLQEPLRAVSGCIQILREQCREKLDAKEEELMAHVISGAERMKDLIQDLLTFARVGTGGTVFRPVNFADVLEDALNNLAVAVHESGALVTHDVLPVVVSDGPQLRQLLQNLIGNAIKFRGGQPARVHVAAERGDGAWHFSVRDSGIGIEPQYFERIFSLFQRLHTRAEYPGTGIGLAICKKVVELHGGTIWVESRPGHGSTFHFTIADRKDEP